MQFTKALQHTLVWKVFNTILSFLINLLLVRMMGAEESGDFYYAITLLSFFTLVMSWSMEAGITYFAANNNDNIPSITLFILPWLLVQGLASWWILHLITININKNLSLLYILSNLVIIYFSALYYAKKWFASINIIVCTINFFVLVSLGGIYYWYGKAQSDFINPGNESLTYDPLALLKHGQYPVTRDMPYLGAMVYFIGFFLQAMALVIVFFIKSAFKMPAPLYQPKLISKIFLYSSIAFVSNILFFLVTRIDYYFVQKYCSEIALSNYVQVSKMGQLLVLLPSIIAGVIFPFSSGMDDKNFLHKLQSLCRIIGLLFIPAVIIIILVGYWLFPWLFGEGFAMMYPALLMYLPGFYCLSLVSMLAAHLAGKGMLIKNLLASAIALIFVIAGDMLFIPIGGIYAAAMVSSMGYFICLIYLLLTYKKKWGLISADFIVTRHSDLQFLFRGLFPKYPFQ